MMRKPKADALSGKDNKRLGMFHATNIEETAAWANQEKTIEESQVAVPSEYDVVKAKNWVDNGSQL